MIASLCLDIDNLMGLYGLHIVMIEAETLIFVMDDHVDFGNRLVA